MRLSTYSFPAFATKYYGDDVQDFWFERDGNEYRIMQQPHRLNQRVAASVIALNVKDAKRELFEFCHLYA